MQSKNTRGVQQHEIEAAADALLAEGLRPTIDRVRQKLGRGSPNTVAPMLEVWFSTLAGRLGVSAGEGAGEGAIPSEVRQATDILWRSALSQAQSVVAQSHAKERESLDLDKQDLLAGQAALTALREQLTQHQQTLRQALAGAQAQTEEAKKRAKTLESELGRKDAELAQARDTLGKSMVERDADRRRFDEQLLAATHEREKQHERSAVSERRLMEEVARARQETKQARSESRSELATMGKKYKTSQSDYLVAQRQLYQAIGDHKVAMAALTEKLNAAERRARDFQDALSVAVSKKIPTTKKKIKA